MQNRGLISLAAFTLTLCFCNVAYANAVSPYVYFWPGYLSVAILFAFPASLLAAFIERPFLSSAGVTHNPLVYSLRANFVSTIVGLLLIPISMFAMYTPGVGILWPLFVFGVSCFVEIRVLHSQTKKKLSTRILITGNAVSAFALMLLPATANNIDVRNTQRVEFLIESTQWMAWTTSSISLLVFLVSLGWETRDKASAGPVENQDSK